MYMGLVHDVSERMCILGCSGGKVSYDPSHQFYCGAVTVDSFCAEIAAQLFCKFWLIQCIDAYKKLPVRIF